MTRQLIATVKANLLHEALQRAIRIAPTKGAGFDRAAGILFEIHDTEMWIKVTDLERQFFQKLPITSEMQTSFRLHTNVARFVASLPMGTDQDVRFHIDDAMGRIEVQYMKSPTKVKMSTIQGEYPQIPWHDYAAMDDAFELSGKLQAVSWAIEDSAVGTLSGVSIDGEWIEAMSSKMLARIKCNVQTDMPVIGVLKTLAPLIAQGSRVRLKALEGRIVVALDETAQVSASSVLGQWPDLSSRIDKIELMHGFTINRQRLLDALGRIIGFTQGDRFPRINFDIQGDRVILSLTDPKDGDITDTIALSHRVGDEPCQFCFNPVWLQKAIDTFPGGEVQVKYATWNKPIKLVEPMTSYNALIMGLDPGEKMESPKEDDD